MELATSLDCPSESRRGSGHYGSFRPSFWGWAYGEEGACTVGFKEASVLGWLPYPPREP